MLSVHASYLSCTWSTVPVLLLRDLSWDLRILFSLVQCCVSSPVPFSVNWGYWNLSKSLVDFKVFTLYFLFFFSPIINKSTCGNCFLFYFFCMLWKTCIICYHFWFSVRDVCPSFTLALCLLMERWQHLCPALWVSYKKTKKTKWSLQAS